VNVENISFGVRVFEVGGSEEEVPGRERTMPNNRSLPALFEKRKRPMGEGFLTMAEGGRGVLPGRRGVEKVPVKPKKGWKRRLMEEEAAAQRSFWKFVRQRCWRALDASGAPRRKKSRSSPSRASLEGEGGG